MNTISDIGKRCIANYNARKEILYEKGIFRYLTSSSGYVLAIVLVMTSLLMTISAEFIVSARTNIGIMNKYKNSIIASYLARSGVELSKSILYIDQKGGASMSSEISGVSSDRNVDGYKDVWAFDYPPLPIENGTVTIAISDEQSKINLSILANESVDKTPYYGIVQNFFMKMGFPPDLADSILDWVDIDDMPSPYGAESRYYLQDHTPPYSARNTAMESIDDLLLLKGMTPEIFYGLGGGTFGMEKNLVDDNKGSSFIDIGKMQDLKKDMKDLKKIIGAKESHRIGPEKSRRLSDYFRVHGERTNWTDEVNKININTASYRVVSALTEDMTDDIVTEIIMRRILEPFKSVSELSDLITNETVRKNVLTVKSSLFKISSKAVYGNATVTINVIYNRELKKILYWSEE